MCCRKCENSEVQNQQHLLKNVLKFIFTAEIVKIRKYANPYSI